MRINLYTIDPKYNLYQRGWGVSTDQEKTLIIDVDYQRLLDEERKTRLELATPTLARLCSTN